ncbi:sugar fermentation stimulation protein A [Hydrogenispora ethanolica]|uniref:Sugar fermentation stimulation protein homolog n=1 Tax=Hydrogenispora ethanolica TaxID=1082276 RepID=A0A4R1QTI2_HYDET|nr:DNA/RNA nuclease SfsA [Hydrogenispora ethanolica]TCL56817.1 sugar fermentation stimulation protein A [Hydrogenispora ethanolica]
MKFANLRKGLVVRRLNRFVVEARDEAGRMFPLHLANSGRLRELIVPGRELRYEPCDGDPCRKTAGRLQLLRNEAGLWVCIDAVIPNAVVGEALGDGALEAFRDYPEVRREHTMGDSRLDFFLSNGGQHAAIEVKSVTLVESGVALFPDAPTERGLKHLHELARLCSEGLRAAVIFLIQREDALRFTPNDRTQPEFRAKLREVRKLGVQVLAYDCRVTEREIRLRQPVPVEL